MPKTVTNSPAPPIKTAVAARLLDRWPVRRWADVTVVVGVSGGLDSICLLHLLAELRPAGAPGRLVVAHFDHAIRPESQADARFVAELAASLDLECVLESASTPLTSDEAALRTARNDFLARTVRGAGARYLALAHHADDQAETVLHRILRGAGPRGASGMLPYRPLDAGAVLVRPLLDVPRRWLLEMATQESLSYREDPTNRDIRYTRNWLRRSILPQLRERLPGADAALCRLASSLQQERTVSLRWAEHLLDQAVQSHSDSLHCDCDQLRSVPLNVLIEMFALLWQAQGWPQAGMTSDHWQKLQQAISDETTPVFCLPGDLRVQRTPTELVLRPLDRGDASDPPARE